MFEYSTGGALRYAHSQGLEDKPEGFDCFGDNIVYLNGMLDRGDISTNSISCERQRMILQRIQSPFYYKHPISSEKAKEIVGKYVADYQRLVKFADSQQELCIWCTNSPHSVCGLFCLLSELPRWKGKISIIQLPKFVSNGNETLQPQRWPEVEVQQIYKLFSNRETAPSDVQKFTTERWNSLQRENSPLRVLVNGNIVSVEKDFYDAFILAELRRCQPVQMGELMNRLMNRYEGLGVYGIWERLEFLMQKGNLQTKEKKLLSPFVQQYLYVVE